MDKGLSFVKPRKGDKVRCPFDNGTLYEGVVLQVQHVKKRMRVEFPKEGRVWVALKHKETFVVIFRKVCHFFRSSSRRGGGIVWSRVILACHDYRPLRKRKIRRLRQGLGRSKPRGALSCHCPSLQRLRQRLAPR